MGNFYGGAVCTRREVTPFSAVLAGNLFLRPNVFSSNHFFRYPRPDGSNLGAQYSDFSQSIAWVIAVLHLSERIFFVSRFLVTRSMPKYYSCAIALTEHESENEFNIPKTT